MKSLSPQVSFGETKIFSEVTVLFQGVLSIKYLSLTDTQNESATAYFEIFWFSSKVRVFKCQGQTGNDM